MKKFDLLSGVAAPLPIVNVDTDMIMPKQFLKTIKRTGLGEAIFFDMRYDENDLPRPEFILNKKEFKNSQILLAGKNFGCGSSREHAPWGLLDFGIKCVIAPSFAEIFYSNCFKNGILCITLSEELVKVLVGLADGRSFKVDLVNKEIIPDNASKVKFDIDETRRHNLLNGLDDIALTMQQIDKIKSFEKKQNLEQPWLYE
ncbi:MAG: 3-isopropylmalate dehydratase small subunit [Alphaproteobacteria bacterium TMED87]|mgnify:FL=1|nr:3-isopropylmalate dehydratase small subunit [Rhodospirillaceae bacterium]OUV07593.1 MAG: 3-isopropylmalate dehydratase small subunit [Alphaproteobacteria bacterium TMED87]|tara:strand:+ start:62 stop:664 length:603 start_codon:yes stop_codon:yes gene_type:complete